MPRNAALTVHVGPYWSSSLCITRGAPCQCGRYSERSIMISGPAGAMQAKTDAPLARELRSLQGWAASHMWSGTAVQIGGRNDPGLNVNDRAAEAPEAAPQRVSELLEQLSKTWPHERVSLGDVTRLLGERGYGVLMFVLALPGAVPGVASIAAIPLALVAVQLAVGLPRPWLPRFLAARSLSRADFARMVERVAPHLSRVERLLRPR